MKNHLFFSSLLTLLITTLAFSTLEAQRFGRNKVQYQTFDFQELRTDHYRLFFYNDMRPIMPDIARMSERWYERLSLVSNHDYREGDRKPLIFYADDADFRQTNIVPGFIPGGVRGLAEPRRGRVVMPLAPNTRVTHQILGHELVHSFQFDMANRAGLNLNNISLWMMEGMAEYFTLGRQHPETAMWMRDAVLNDKLPTLSDLARQDRFNPYRYGHAWLAYLGGVFGDENITPYFEAIAVMGPSAATNAVFLTEPDVIIERWHQALRDQYQPLLDERTPMEDLGQLVLARERGHSRINLAPSLSPNGEYVTFLTARIPLGIDLVVADAETGELLANLGGVDEDPHLDDIRFLNSGGTWDPESSQIAFISFSRGVNVISIWSLRRGRIVRNIRLPDIPALENPSWSPDGTKIAVAGIVGGRSNIYVYDLEQQHLEQLTDDDYSSLQPQWSPDGRNIVYVTDAGPGATDMEELNIKPTQIAIISAEGTNNNPTYFSPFGETAYSNPHFSSDGESLYFISRPLGFLDIFRYEFETGNMYQVTQTQTGIVGVTEDSPALTIARDTGKLMFSIFAGDEYSIAALDNRDTEMLVEDLQADPTAPGGVLPPYEALGLNMVESYLADHDFGLLPPDTEITMQDHGRRLSLAGILPAQIGVGVGGVGGTQVAGGGGAIFSDLLNDYELGVAFGLQISDLFTNISGQLSFINRRHRINYGAQALRVPQLFASSFITQDPVSGNPVLNRLIDRVTINQAAVLLENPISTTRRYEYTLGASLYQFDRLLQEFELGPGGIIIDERRQDLQAREDIYFGSGSVAYVLDNSLPGFTAPIQGARLRLQAAPFVGTVQFARLLADLRRYVFLNPVTIAFRAAHQGNYWADIDDPFTTEYLGYPNTQTYVRGYNLFTFRTREFSDPNGDTDPFNRLIGTHVALTNLEVRFPLLGTEDFGLFSTRILPIELAFFLDGGVAWTRDDPPVIRLDTNSTQRIPVFSTGLSSRLNLFGALVLEFYVVYPFQRPDRGTHLGFQFIPGW